MSLGGAPNEQKYTVIVRLSGNNRIITSKSFYTISSNPSSPTELNTLKLLSWNNEHLLTVTYTDIKCPISVNFKQNVEIRQSNARNWSTLPSVCLVCLEFILGQKKLVSAELNSVSRQSNKFLLRLASCKCLEILMLSCYKYIFTVLIFNAKTDKTKLAKNEQKEKKNINK